MSALRELLRVIGAWEDDLTYVAIGVEVDGRHLKLARSTLATDIAVAVRGTVHRGDACDFIVDQEPRTLMSPEDVRAELRWLSMGEES